MWRISRFLSVSGVAALILSALIAVSPNLARAQDSAAETNDWEASPGSGAVVAQPDKKQPPLDLAGCWSGTIDDDATGTGSGFLSFLQKGTKLTVDGQLDFNGGPNKRGILKGKANSKNFQLSAHSRKCNVSFHGTISSGDHLTGMYHLSKKCLGAVDGGNFDYTFDGSGSSCQ